ncbi:glycosyltransferase [Salana multivorans]
MTSHPSRRRISGARALIRSVNLALSRACARARKTTKERDLGPRPADDSRWGQGGRPTGRLRPRVILATRVFAPEPAAAAFRLEQLVHGLVRTGAEVEVLTVRARGEYDAPSGVQVRRWPVLRDANGYVRGYLQYASFDVPLLMRLLTTPRARAVVVEPPPTTGAVVRLVCALRRIPYVWYAADVWSDAAESTGAPRFVVAALRALERWVIGGASVSLAVSDAVADRVSALGGRRVEVVGNGVDTEVFGATGRRRGDSRTLVYAGTASEWQGADIFARAMPRVLREVPDACLVYLGQGSAIAEIERLAQTLPRGVVTVLGTVPALESAQWLRGAAGALVSIVPDRGYDFAIPTKVFAALGTGTPVLYAGVGPVVDILSEPGLGLAVDYDVEAVAEGMARLLRDESAEGAAAVREGRARWVVANRSLRAVADRAAAVVRDVAG